MIGSAAMAALANLRGARADDAPSTQPSPEWKSLFDGKTLDGWTVSDFGGHGEPSVADGTLIIPDGEGLTGVTRAGKVPTDNYEVTLEAQRISGSDIFCGLTFPMDQSYASLILGGWGGAVCGISSLDGEDASSNVTTTRRKFETGKWYRITLRVAAPRIQAWIDGEKLVDVDTSGDRVTVREDIDASRPFGFATWRTTSALRDIRIREIKTK